MRPLSPPGRPGDPQPVDVALVGAGGAGLAVLHALALGLLAEPAGSRGSPVVVGVVDNVERLLPGLQGRPADRTWCFWEDAPAVAPAVLRSWPTAVVHGAASLRLDLAPLRYSMLRSQDYYALVAQAADRAEAAGLLRLVRRPAATAVDDGRDSARVRTPAGDLQARWVLDSRPSPPVRPARTALLQHFRGQVVRTDPAAPAPFDPDLPVLMDFRTRQPPVGLSFGYCLPLGPRTALVEYTEFSPQVLGDAGYAAGLADYRRLLGIDGGDGGPGVRVVAVDAEEHGVIPMADDVRRARAGVRVRRLGTAGGATRPSTGYTFSALQRQGRAAAAALLAGRDPSPPRAYPRRHAWMDSLVLRGLASGRLDGPAFLGGLFAANPAHRVLRFLDGATSPAEEVALMATAPRGTMVRLAVLDAAARSTGRLALHRVRPGERRPR